MASLVYDTKKNKTYAIHPSMAKDKVWMAAHGLIPQEELKPFSVTNMPDVENSGEAQSKPKTKTTK